METLKHFQEYFRHPKSGIQFLYKDETKIKLSKSKMIIINKFYIFSIAINFNEKAVLVIYLNYKSNK